MHDEAESDDLHDGFDTEDEEEIHLSLLLKTSLNNCFNIERFG